MEKLLCSTTQNLNADKDNLALEKERNKSKTNASSQFCKLLKMELERPSQDIHFSCVVLMCCSVHIISFSLSRLFSCSKLWCWSYVLDYALYNTVIPAVSVAYHGIAGHIIWVILLYSIIGMSMMVFGSICFFCVILLLLFFPFFICPYIAFAVAIILCVRERWVGAEEQSFIYIYI